MLWVLKEPSQWDGSFVHPKHMFKLIGKKIITILHSKNVLIWTYAFTFANSLDPDKAWSGSKLFDTLIVTLNFLLEKAYTEEKNMKN